MNAEMIQNAIGDIQDEYIQDAETRADRKLLTWTKWLPLAACLIVAVLVAAPLLSRNGATPKDAPTNGEIRETADVETTGGIETTGRSGGATPYPVSNPGDLIDLEAGAPIYYASYDEFAQNVQDPVFDAFANGDEGRNHELVFGIEAEDDFYTSGSMDNLTAIELIIDGNEIAQIRELPKPDSAVTIDCTYNTSDPNRGFGLNGALFDAAEEYGVLTSINVDGVEIQKYDSVSLENAIYEDMIAKNPDDEELAWEFDRFKASEYIVPDYYARVNINDVWYVLYGRTESNVDAMATALAHIAAQL